MAVIEVSSANFNEEVLQSDKPVLVDFNAAWCGPCRMLKPMLDELAAERDDVKVVSVNIDDEEDLAEEYDVTSIPCLVLMKNGEEADRSVGLLPRDALLDFIGG